jgi:MFS family permease
MRPTNASLITKRTQSGQGAAIGMMDSFDSLGRILGPMLAGRVYATDPRLPFAVSAAILTLASLALVLRGALRAPGNPPRP